MKDTDNEIRIPRLWCSARLNLAILTMLGCVCFYSLRVNVSFSVVCMVNYTAISAIDAAANADRDAAVVVVAWNRNSSDDSISGNVTENRYLAGSNGNVNGNSTENRYLAGSNGNVSGNSTENRYLAGSNGNVSGNSTENRYLAGINGNGSGSDRNDHASGQCGSDEAASSAESYEDGELVWNKEQQGLVLGSIFWGYMLTNVAGGIVATHYGGKRVIGGALAIASVLTALTPSAARSSVYAVIGVRVLVGVCLGCISPALHALWAQWAPPQESSKLRSFCFAGCQMGYVMTFPVTALLCEYGFDGGWPTVFYVMAAGVLAWCVSWMLLVTDSPLDHPRISEEERDYIVNSLKGTISLKKKRGHRTPWLKVLGSRPVWAAFIAHTCFNWGEYTFLTNIPTYLREVLLFDIKANGFLSALPYICFWFVINVSGHVADVIRRKRLLDTTKTRKLFNFLGSVVPAGLLIGVGFLDCSHSAVAVALLTMGVAMTGCLYGGGLYINFADLSPRHAGVLYGISNTIATIPGFVAPIVIGIITHDQKQESWRWVFFLASLIYVIGCVFFFVLGSGDIQPWAVETEELEVSPDDEKLSPLTNGKAELDGGKDWKAYSEISNSLEKKLEGRDLISEEDKHEQLSQGVREDNFVKT